MVSQLSWIITHPLIYTCAHWTKRITWYKIGKRVSANIARPPISKSSAKQTKSHLSRSNVLVRSQCVKKIRNLHVSTCFYFN